MLSDEGFHNFSYRVHLIIGKTSANFARPIDKRERGLERKGPVWRAPLVIDVLRNLPFLRHVPQRAVEVFYRHGRLRMYRRCQAVRVSGQDGLVIVINGLVRISYRDPFGNHQQFFLGTGASPQEIRQQSCPV